MGAWNFIERSMKFSFLIGAMVICLMGVLSSCAHTLAGPHPNPKKAWPLAAPVSPVYYSADPQTAPGAADLLAVADQGEAVTLLAVGDLMFGRHVGDAMEDSPGIDPFGGLGGVLRWADLTVGNLECVLGHEGDFRKWKAYEKIRLGAGEEAVIDLKHAGFDFLSLANNHALDYGKEGLQSTQALLESKRLRFCGTWTGEGTNAPVILEARGYKVAFLAYSDVSPSYFKAKSSSPGTIPPLISILRRDIPAAKKEADWVVVSVHWGKEYETKPNDRQRQIAHRMIDLGADVVLGHHPHVLQPFERYHGGFVAYSLGNFLFDLQNPVARDSMLLRVVLVPNQEPRIDWAPVAIQDCFPNFLTGEAAEKAWAGFPKSLSILREAPRKSPPSRSDKKR